ncbi:metal transporter [Cellvibrio zantedeschiae]|uniref:Metal transporter n=1 Tax=Cellvibrio zantedeschiae TaxID=1237077 RepID=A0ABQ3AQT9_9GAMM|nr:TolC family protein [Cellvibrio zantedeschiae]GGY63732.1 metal transporter [Cellvibrio zantedeschiae]
MRTFPPLIALGAITFFILATPVYAQNSLRLQQVIQSTLQNNPQLAGYEFQLKALRGEQQTAALKPGLHLSAQFENIAGSGSFKAADAAELTLSLSSIIELGGKSDARLGVVTARQQQLASTQRVLTLDVLTQATQQFITLAATQEELKLLQQRLNAAQENTKSLSKQWDAGRTPEADVLRAKASVVRATIELEKKRQQMDSERVKLSAFWMKPQITFAQPKFTEVEANLFLLPQSAPLDTLLAKLESNPDLAVLSDQIQLRTAELRQAQTERSANLTWNAGVRRLQISDDSALVVGMSMPLGSASRATGALTTARANQAGAELEHDATRTKLQAHLIHLHGAYEQALAEVNSLRADAIPLLSQAMRTTQNGFNQGRYSYLELNLAQRELLEMQLELINAAARAHLLASEIERITGTALNATPSSNLDARTQP